MTARLIPRVTVLVSGVSVKGLLNERLGRRRHAGPGHDRA
jgi:hypothetical protein